MIITKNLDLQMFAGDPDDVPIVLDSDVVYGDDESWVYISDIGCWCWQSERNGFSVKNYANVYYLNHPVGPGIIDPGEAPDIVLP